MLTSLSKIFLKRSVRGIVSRAAMEQMPYISHFVRWASVRETK